MNAFHTLWRFISAHDSVSTIGKKIANSTVGKTTRRRLCLARRGTLAKGAAGRGGAGHGQRIGASGARLERRNTPECPMPVAGTGHHGASAVHTRPTDRTTLTALMSTTPLQN